MSGIGVLTRECKIITCGTAESAGVSQIGEEFATADVIEKHVEEGLVVMSPHPGQKRERD